MKLSLQRRIQFSFYLSIALVAGIGAISFYYISQLNDQVQQIVERDLALSNSNEKVKNALTGLQRVERIYLLSPETPDFYLSMQQAIDTFRVAAEEGKELSLHEESRHGYQKILEWLKEYETLIKGTQLPFNPRELARSLDEKTRNIRGTVAELARSHYDNLEAHRQQAAKLSDSSSRNLILMIATTILAGLAIGFFAPSKVVLPFHKLVVAMQEVQAANFNVSVHIGGHDEIAELGREFNKMVEEIRIFDDMKIKKIAFEKRKLDALASIVDAGVLVLSIEGTIVYMNRYLYQLLGVTSERVLQTALAESLLPDELKILFHEAIERKDRFENRKGKFTVKLEDDTVRAYRVLISLAPVRNHVGDVVNFVIAMRQEEEPEKEPEVVSLI